MIALALLLLLGGGENRAWSVEVEVAGPLDELRLVCGADGLTRLVGPLLPGERRLLEVPVPVRSPLGPGALASVPLPRLETDPGEAAGRCRVVGWSEGGEEALQRGAGALLARPRPPAPAGDGVRPGAPELLLTAAVLFLLVRLRGRGSAQAVLGIGAGIAIAALARGRGVDAATRVLVEADRDVATALRISAALGRVALAAHLEVQGAAGGLEFLVPIEGGRGEALAPGRTLHALEPVAPPELAPGRNDWGDLERVWLRSATGQWTDHGPWARDAALGPSRGGSEPPGWLAAALPPGRPVLAAAAGGERWLRLVGFPAPASESAPAGD